MKNNRNHKSNGNGHNRQQVRVEFNRPVATAVAIAGTFNDWRPEVTPMVLLGDGRWVKELALPPGVYEYRIVVDGEWMPDPRASETTPNPFGEMNSVLRVQGSAK
jgi:1,4-alpha-glucan branching enzyme